MIYLKAQMHPEGDIASAIGTTHEPRFHFEFDGMPSAIGLAWHIFNVDDTQKLIYFHNGMMGGFTSVIEWQPSTDTGLFILSNQAPVYAHDGTGATDVQMNVVKEAGSSLLKALDQNN